MEERIVMEEKELYRVYSEDLKKKYGEKVYRIPIQLPVSCPNREALTGKGGCIFCGDIAAGFEALSPSISVRQQMQENIAYIAPRYKAKKFIAYFQNFTNTYLPVTDFRRYMQESVTDQVVEIAVSTRPDCIDDRYLSALDEVSKENNLRITVELGLQSINHHTLRKINRGHTLAEFIDAVNMIHRYGFEITTHMILNLPYDDEEDIIEGAKILSALRVHAVKLHALYIVRNTELAREYEQGRIDMGTVGLYVDRTVTFLEYLSPEIVIQRLIGRAPEEETLFCNYGLSWWRIKDMILEEMRRRGSVQGSKFDYLAGKSVRNL